MRTFSSVWALVIALVIAHPIGAANNKTDSGKDPGIPYFKTIDRYLMSVTLTEGQKTKFDALKKEYEPKFKEAYVKQDVPRRTKKNPRRGQEGSQGGGQEGQRRQGRHRCGGQRDR